MRKGIKYLLWLYVFGIAGIVWSIYTRQLDSFMSQLLIAGVIISAVNLSLGAE